MRPASPRGGVLFAITDAPQKVVELGLALTPVRGGLQSILLFYTDTDQTSHSHKAAAFSVPDMTDQWTRFTVSSAPSLHMKDDVPPGVCGLLLTPFNSQNTLQPPGDV